MSRELKFRCWNNASREYIPEDELMENFAEYLHEEHLYIEQYTGLKDKNGIEICEGDIAINLLNFRRGRIVWVEKEAGFGLYEYHKRNDGGFGLGCSPLPKYGLEVIGNVHDKPELLEGEK